MKILVIDFGASDIVDQIPKDCKVIVEKNDGGKAYKLAGDEMPDMIFVNYAANPSHARETAKSIKDRKKTEAIPIYFVEGDEPNNEKIDALGSRIRSGQIASVIESGRARGG